MSTNSILATAPLVTTNFLLRATGTTIGNSLIFDNGTNVGIGNTNTTYKLDVSGTGNFTGALSGTSATFSSGITSVGGSNQEIAASATGDFFPRLKLIRTAGTTKTNRNYSFDLGSTGSLTLEDNTASATRLTIDTNGNLGLGVTPSNGWVNGKALEVGFVGSAVWGRYVNEFHLTNNYYFSASSNSRLYASTAQASDYEQYAGGHTWYTAPSGTINTAVTFTPRMAITNGGNVLIGTTTDNGYKLQFVNDGNTGSAAYVLYSQYYGGIVAVNATSSSYYAFKVRNGSNAATSTGTDIFTVRADGFINAGTFTYNNAVSGRTMIVESGGGLGYLVSTRESKANIKSIENVDFINQLNAVQFNYRKKDLDSNTFTDELYDNTTYGFIADEVEKVNKELVFYNEDGSLAGVEYNSIIAILTKAVQELRLELNELKNK
jgi:hypothetical protein